MLNRSSRLTTKQFNEVMKDGKVSHSAFFMARIQASSEPIRIAAVAPVKIAKTAVLRNRTRRRIYAALRTIFTGVPAQGRVILIAKAPFLQAEDVAAVRDDLKSLFVKAGLLR